MIAARAQPPAIPKAASLHTPNGSLRGGPGGLGMGTARTIGGESADGPGPLSGIAAGSDGLARDSTGSTAGRVA
ncbi:MAG TPA: hypothetical protein VFF52_31275 [Isosphaeraceae bacterium]|nr:hypothetical protein [Isosphaeraceae bacterium]